jgi:GntR family transcriptional regulator
MLIDPKNPIPIFRQIADQLRQSIDAGVYKSGEMLPSLRVLAVDIKVNPNTVQRAYDALEREGVVETRRGVGIFVSKSSRTKLNATEKRLKRQLAQAIRDGNKAGLTLESIRLTFDTAMREYLSGSKK